MLTPTLVAGATIISDKDGMMSVYIPAGEFLMGAALGDKLWESDEKPQHKVYLENIGNDKTEVTNGKYAKCVQDGKCTEPRSVSSHTHKNYYNNPSYADYPMINVTWYQADKYCKWIGGKLPSEAEWEKSARGINGATYPWGEGIDCGKANYAWLSIED